MVSTSPEQARTLLTSHPQLAYALFQAMLMMNIVDQPILQRILVASGASAAPASGGPPHQSGPPPSNPYQNQPQFNNPHGNGTPPHHQQPPQNMYQSNPPPPGPQPGSRPPIYGQQPSMPPPSAPPQQPSQAMPGANLGEEQRVSRTFLYEYVIRASVGSSLLSSSSCSISRLTSFSSASSSCFFSILLF